MTTKEWVSWNRGSGMTKRISKPNFHPIHSNSFIYSLHSFILFFHFIQSFRSMLPMVAAFLQALKIVIDLADRGIGSERLRWSDKILVKKRNYMSLPVVRSTIYPHVKQGPKGQRCVLMLMEWLHDDVIAWDYSWYSLKKDRQTDGLTDQWTDRLSYRDGRMHIVSKL